ncbi:MAG: zinc-binding dehydrogenase [Dehalococcoidia bacterium]
MPIPPSLGDAEGSFVEPLAVVLHAISRSRLTSDEPVAVVGAGPIGLLLIEALRARGARCVIAIEPRPARRELALQLGARAAIDPLTGNPGRDIAALLDGARAAVAFECVGTTAGFETALRSTGRGGRVVLIGLLPASASVNLLAVLAHEKEIIGASAYVDEFDEAIRLLAGRSVVVGPLVTGEISIEETVIGGLEVLGRPDSAHVKILVRPH